MVERIGEQYAYGPILRYQVVEGRIQEITPEGYEFLGLSPSGERILARAQSRLVLLDLAGAESARITDHLLDSGARAAVWVPDTDSVVYIEDGADTRLSLYDAVTQGQRELEGTDGALDLIPPSNAHSVVWLSPPCSSDGRCESPSAVDVITGFVRPLPDLLRPTFDPTEAYLAFLYSDDQQRRRLALAPADRSRTIRPGVPGDNILDYVWSPDGAGLLVVALVRSDYSGRWFGSRQFIITPGTWDLRELPQTDTANALGVWSPDGYAVALAGTQPDPSGYIVTLRRIDLNTRKVEILEPGVDLSRPNYVFVSMMAWRPLR
jgi:Tol biopolymer transport system component